MDDPICRNPVFPRRRFAVLALAGLALWPHGLEWGTNTHAEDDTAGRAIDEWIVAQGRLESWRAEFQQTRRFPALARPLTATGRVVFRAPASFRWQLGEPARTVAIRAADQVLILYPRLRRAERYPLTDDAKGPWRDAMTMLDAGFARDRAGLEKRFEITTASVSDGIGTLEMRPRATSSREWLKVVVFTFAVGRAGLESAEFRFRDGTVMRNDFTHAVVNPDLPDGLFSTTVPEDFSVSEPVSP